jgi:hypothetical protein
MTAGQIALGLFTYTVLVISALLALLLYLVEAFTADFMDSALEAPARVVSIEDQNYGDRDVMVTVTYTNQQHRSITGVINDGNSTDFSVDQNITILYDPQNPQIVKSIEERKIMQLLSSIKLGSLLVFILTLGMTVYSATNRNNSEERIKRN